MNGAAGLIVAALGGAAVGLERQRSGHATGRDRRLGGLRTFTLLGLAGGMAGTLSAAGAPAPGGILLAAAALIVVAAYVRSSRHDVDATTEAAALVVIAAGAMAGGGHMWLASATICLTALLLIEKSRLHALAVRIDDEALRASLRFAALAIVVLPLLPTGAYGPFGAFRPRELWAVVLFFSGLSFAAWIGRRLLGPHEGVVAAGLLGGVISSTSVTFAFARASRERRAARFALAFGAIGACTVMFVRVAIASAVLNRALSLALIGRIWPAVLVAAAALSAGWWVRDHRKTGAPHLDGSPLQLKTALQMTVLFQLVLFGIGAAMLWWGARALVAMSALIGMTDLDALTLSLSRNTPPDGIALGVKALVAGMISNTIFKALVAIIVGRGAYRLAVGGVLLALAAMLAAAVYP